MKSTQTAFLLALSCVPAALAAQNRVVPPSLNGVEGTNAFYYPFLYDAGRFQQVWEGQAVCGSSAVINQISYRRDADRYTTAFPALVRTSTTVSFGTTPTSPATMTTNFANNLTNAKLTVLVNNANFSLPAQPAPTTAPAPFNIHLPISSPFLFLPANGHLVIDWVLPGTATRRDMYWTDGETQTAASGYVRAFGAFGKFTAGDTPTFSCDAAKLVPGGSVDLTVSGLKAQYSAAAFFGVSDTLWSGLTLPFHLAVIGAPGNYLYTGREIEVGLPVQGSGGSFTGKLTAPLPNNTSFSGLRVFAQTWFADAQANALGVVASNALELVGGTGQGGYTRILGTTTSTSATGFFAASPFGGPVILFSGTVN